MTIDEAIEKYKDITNTDANCPRHCMRPCDECVQECGKIAEWLEELKVLRLSSMMTTTKEIVASQVGYKNGCNKAIDISSRLIYELLDEYDISLWEDITYIELADLWVESIKNKKIYGEEKLIECIKMFIVSKLKEGGENEQSI